MTARRAWPHDRPPAAHEAERAHCEACGLEWSAHRALGGYRLRCECGAWVDVPRTKTLPLATSKGDAPRRLSSGRRPRRSVATSAALRPGALIDAPPSERRPWIDRSLLELIALLACFLLPALASHVLLAGSDRAIALPFTAMLGGLLVLAVATTTRAYALEGMRAARPEAFVEAVAVAALGAALALAWTRHVDGAGQGVSSLAAVRAEIGLPWALFAIALCPAVFEELAFRGILQGRLSALLGRGTGLLLTAAAFALAHGVTGAIVFHAGLGLYLGWLRVRSESLLPGMLLHLIYNGILVVELGATPPGWEH